MRAGAVLSREHQGILNRAGTGAFSLILPIGACADQFVTWNRVCLNSYNFQTKIINIGYDSRAPPGD